MSAGLVRTVLLSLGQSNASLISTSTAISDARDGVDGSGDKDQPIRDGSGANIVPTDEFGLAFARTTQEVLNIVYLSNTGAKGGFFPNGLNGAIS